MLINDFYYCGDVSVSERQIETSVRFNSAHEIFKGHFPQQPVVPGVCMIQIIKELLQNHLNQSFVLRSTGQVKFLQLVLPHMMPGLSIRWIEEGSGFSVTAAFRLETDLFKFSGKFEKL